MISRIQLLLAAIVLMGLCEHAAPAAPLDPITLWPAGAPGALGAAAKDIPTITVYPAAPDKATGAALIVCPGGGYTHLSDREGAGYAEWLAENGIVGIVLKYRLCVDGYHYPAMFDDAARAIRLTRSMAAQLKIDPKRVGIMGSSAGGHVASVLLTSRSWNGKSDATDPVERESSRPDLGVLCYALVTMGQFTNEAARKQLLGENPQHDMIDLLSSENHVTGDTPPCFVWQSDEDHSVNVENALLFASALREKGVPFELHIYEKGKHGMGLGDPQSPIHHRLNGECMAWLREHNF